MKTTVVLLSDQCAFVSFWVWTSMLFRFLSGIGILTFQMFRESQVSEMTGSSQKEEDSQIWVMEMKDFQYGFSVSFDKLSLTALKIKGLNLFQVLYVENRNKGEI